MLENNLAVSLRNESGPDPSGSVGSMGGGGLSTWAGAAAMAAVGFIIRRSCAASLASTHPPPTGSAQSAEPVTAAWKSAKAFVPASAPPPRAQSPPAEGGAPSPGAPLSGSPSDRDRWLQEGLLGVGWGTLSLGGSEVLGLRKPTDAGVRGHPGSFLPSGPHCQARG